MIREEPSATQITTIGLDLAKNVFRRQKNDMADAAAICEAVSRPSMRYVPVKSTASRRLSSPTAGGRFSSASEPR